MKYIIIVSAIIVAAALLLSAGVVVIPGYTPIGRYQIERAAGRATVWVIDTRTGKVSTCVDRLGPGDDSAPNCFRSWSYPASLKKEMWQ